jgi:hypothetical protein
MEEVTRGQLESFLDHVLENNRPLDGPNRPQKPTGVFKWAEDFWELERNPMTGVRRPRLSEN